MTSSKTLLATVSLGLVFLESTKGLGTPTRRNLRGISPPGLKNGKPERKGPSSEGVSDKEHRESLIPFLPDVLTPKTRGLQEDDSSLESSLSDGSESFSVSGEESESLSVFGEESESEDNAVVAGPAVLGPGPDALTGPGRAGPAQEDGGPQRVRSGPGGRVSQQELRVGRRGPDGRGKGRRGPRGGRDRGRMGGIFVVGALRDETASTEEITAACDVLDGYAEKREEKLAKLGEMIDGLEETQETLRNRLERKQEKLIDLMNLINEKC
uniref:Uncharacterized protein n=1 Tax=Trieres chinensis TaxID=1514140 RepID=A0A7S2A1E0_TRICV